jgi:predicted O-methyltransferase YrrM
MLDEFVFDVLHGKGDSDAHLLTLFSICLSIKAKKILELGVRTGSTTKPLLKASLLTGGHVTSVDIDTNPFINDKISNNFTFVQSDALEFLKNSNEKYDLIYIDDWHSYDHVKRELDEIDRLVTPSSVILIHDLMYGNTCPYYHTDLTQKTGQWANGGPYRAVSELNSQFWEFATIPSCNGLTILRKKYSSKY